MIKKPKMVMVDFKQLSKWGLVAEINRVILHPRGLALSYDDETGKSSGALIDEQDFSWTFDMDSIVENQKRLYAFDKLRVHKLNQAAARLRRKEGDRTCKPGMEDE